MVKDGPRCGWILHVMQIPKDMKVMTGRDIWKYRDWLIDAFNKDKPYDQFLTEQLAGDLLPNATDEQFIATAFHRNTMTNDEGGTDNEEFRTAAVIDRVNTTWQALMGTTFACVQCHSHPYDPFSSTKSIISSWLSLMIHAMKIHMLIIRCCGIILKRTV